MPLKVPLFEMLALQPVALFGIAACEAGILWRRSDSPDLLRNGQRRSRGPAVSLLRFDRGMYDKSNNLDQQVPGCGALGAHFDYQARRGLRLAKIEVQVSRADPAAKELPGR
jgi:hypothetical protein